jgi:phage terminase small subunit
MREKKLNGKQKRFVDEYLVDANGKQAAIRAGYSRRTAAVIASRLLRKTHVKTAIANALKERSERLQIGADWGVSEARKKYSELERIIGLDEAELYDVNGSLKPLHELPPIWLQKVFQVSEITTCVCKSERTGLVQTRQVTMKRTNPAVMRAQQIKLLELILKHPGGLDGKVPPTIKEPPAQTTIRVVRTESPIRNWLALLRAEARTNPVVAEWLAELDRRQAFPHNSGDRVPDGAEHHREPGEHGVDK